MIEILTDKQIDAIKRLSPAQYRIFLLIGNGRTREEISKEPGHKMAGKTVDAYMDCLKNKLNVCDNFKLRVLATRFTVYVELTGLVRDGMPKNNIQLKTAA